VGDPDYMLSLARGLSVIRAFADTRTPLTVADAARAAGLSRAAARRCLYTLVQLGYAASADGLFTLTPAVLTLGYAYLGSTSIARLASWLLVRIRQVFSVVAPRQAGVSTPQLHHFFPDRP
jgi:IclR family pca regulon transcriptional regulator